MTAASVLRAALVLSACAGAQVASAACYFVYAPNNELIYRNMWLTTYRSLIAQQKGCVRLRRRLNKLLGKPATREGREG